MKKIFSLYATGIMFWMLFSAVNYCFPGATNTYQAWNCFTMGYAVISRTALFIALTFISMCIGYSMCKSEYDVYYYCINKNIIKFEKIGEDDAYIEVEDTDEV